MAFTEQFSAFFDSAQGFAVAAVYNGATNIDVILDRAYFEDRPGFAGVASSKPMALAIENNVPNAAAGDTLLIGSTTYTVTEVQKDGVGLTMLMLRV